MCEVRQGVLFTCSTVVGDISEFDSARFAVFGVENQTKGLSLKKTFHFFQLQHVENHVEGLDMVAFHEGGALGIVISMVVNLAGPSGTCVAVFANRMVMDTVLF